MLTPPPTRDELRKALGVSLKKLRKKAGLAQEHLAFEARINRRYMGGLEQGLHTPTLETIYKLLGPLGVSATEFCRELERALRQKHR